MTLLLYQYFWKISLMSKFSNLQNTSFSWNLEENVQQNWYTWDNTVFRIADILFTLIPKTQEVEISSKANWKVESKPL